MDIFPTLASATGVTPGGTLALDGIDHWRQIRDRIRVEREDGLRRHPGPHPGWRPPHDWARAMAPAEDFRWETESDFLNEGTGDNEAAAGVFIYLTPEERAAMRGRASPQ
jgi:hypothetical protein